MFGTEKNAKFQKPIGSIVALSQQTDFWYLNVMTSYKLWAWTAIIKRFGWATGHISIYTWGAYIPAGVLGECSWLSVGQSGYHVCFWVFSGCRLKVFCHKLSVPSLLIVSKGDHIRPWPYSWPYPRWPGKLLFNLLIHGAPAFMCYMLIWTQIEVNRNLTRLNWHCDECHSITQRYVDIRLWLHNYIIVKFSCTCKKWNK